MIKLTYEASRTLQMHYSDFHQFTDKSIPVVKQMCVKLLQEKVEQTQLWIYRNEDVNYKYPPDVVYNIQEASENSSCRYLQRNLNY